MNLDWPEFFDKLMVEVWKNTLYSYRAEYQLSIAMQSSKGLEGIEHLHVNEISDRFVRYFISYGSTWEEQKLKKLALVLFKLSDLVYIPINTTETQDRNIVIEWARKMAQTLLRECLPE